MSGHVIKTARYSIIILILLVVSGLMGYFIRIALAKKLSVAEYGLFYSVFALFNFLLLFLDLGVSQGAIIKIVKYRVKNKFNEIKNLSLSILYLQLLLATLFSAIFLLFQNFLSVHYYHADISRIALPFCLYFITVPITLFISNTIYGFGKSVFQSLLDAVKNIFVLLAILTGFYAFGLSINAPPYAYVLSNILALLMFTPLFLKIFPNFFKLKFSFVFPAVWDTFKYGIYVTMASMGWTIITQTDTLMLTYYSTLQNVGIYQVALPISMVLFFFAGAIGAAIYPLFSEFEAKKEFRKLSEMTSLIYSYIEIAVLPAAVVFFVYPDLIINTLFGAKFLGGIIVLQIFAIATPVMIIGNINYIILAAIGQAKKSFKMVLFSALLNLILNFILIPKYGIVGAAISSVLAFSSLFILSTIQLQRIYRFTIPYWKLIKILFSSLIFLLSIHLLKNYLRLNPFIEAVVVLAIGGLVYAGLLFATRTINLKMIKILLGLQREI